LEEFADAEVNILRKENLLVKLVFIFE